VKSPGSPEPSPEARTALESRPTGVSLVSGKLPSARLRRITTASRVLIAARGCLSIAPPAFAPAGSASGTCSTPRRRHGRTDSAPPASAVPLPLAGRGAASAGGERDCPQGSEARAALHTHRQGQGRTDRGPGRGARWEYLLLR